LIVCEEKKVKESVGSDDLYEESDFYFHDAEIDKHLNSACDSDEELLDYSNRSLHN
jgi:hypothetical protein